MIVHRFKAPTRRRCWRESYPVLLGCMIDGRRPSAGEVETVATRMLRELGRDRAAGPGRADEMDDLRQRILAAARVALEGELRPECGHPQSPLVLRGH